MACLKLKRGSRARVLTGHPWVFAGEVTELLPEKLDGEVVECRDARGYLLGSGIYNSRSKIIWRRFSREKVKLDSDQLKELISKAIARREEENVRRLVWSESDHLPGLVVDQYEKKLVVQTLTLAMEKRLEEIVSVLIALLEPECVVVRNDVPSRKLEGLEEKVFVIHGEEPEPDWISVGKIKFFIDILRGQKTGFYLDQRKEYEYVANLSKDKKVLDCFCNQGGFALYCAKAGAKEVVGVDISADAVEQSQKNAEYNRLDVKFEAANVFDYFREKKKDLRDVIVLDPPPFARSKAKLDDARRGYKEINLRAMQNLISGGILATYCCSHHVTRDIFRSILNEAANDARKTLRVIRSCFQSLDHPVLLNFPESEYLNGYILEII